jgi:hypothetical protein
LLPSFVSFQISSFKSKLDCQGLEAPSGVSGIILAEFPLCDVDVVSLFGVPGSEISDRFSFNLVFEKSRWNRSED